MIKLAVQATPEAAKLGAPTERVAVFVRDAKGRIDGTTQFLDLASLNADDPSAGRLELKVPTAALVGRGPDTRGRRAAADQRLHHPFLLRPTGGARVDFKPFRLWAADRRAGRPQPQAGLDHFHSRLLEQHVGAYRDGRPGRRPSDSAARSGQDRPARHALGTGGQGDARVGVIFYGHRVGWNLKNPEQILRQTDYARPIPDDLRPSEDVETVLPLGRFDSVVAGGVFDLMKSLKPWGETPLYLSVIQAVGEFAADEPGTEKSIVVITDGANYQFNSPNPKAALRRDGRHGRPQDRRPYRRLRYPGRRAGRGDQGVRRLGRANRRELHARLERHIAREIAGNLARPANVHRVRRLGQESSGRRQSAQP